jgi:hypothetical protein
MTSSELITKARLRRNIHWGWLLLWPIGGPLLLAVFGRIPRTYLTFDPGPILTLLVWFSVWVALGAYQMNLKCVFCGKRAFGLRPFLFVPKRCVSCGRSFKQDVPDA